MIVNSGYHLGSIMQQERQQYFFKHYLQICWENEWGEISEYYLVRDEVI
jgi:hypothetical protein